MNDWEKSRAEEKAKEEAMRKKFIAVLHELGFKAQAQDPENRTARAVAILNPANGQSITLMTSSWDKWRINVYGNYPEGPKRERLTVYEQVEKTRQYGTPPEKYLSWDEVKEERITISSDKTPAQIAADITRRFMPSYVKRLALVREKIAQMNEYQNKTDCVFAAVIGRAPTKEEADRREYSFYHDSGHLGQVKFSKDRADIEISDVTPDQARRIVAIIKEVKKDR